MSAAEPIATPFLVLRRTPYGETSLVVAGITPAAGQLHGLVRGGRRLGPRQFPVVDLFRLIQVAYRPGRSGLHRIVQMDLLEDFGAVARHPASYRAAGWLADFALRNTQPEIEHPAFFQAMCLGLHRLAEAHCHAGRLPAVVADAVITGVCLTYLDEGGWAVGPSASAAPLPRLPELLDMAAGRGQAPHLSVAAWRTLRREVEEMLVRAECQLPEPPRIPGT